MPAKQFLAIVIVVFLAFFASYILLRFNQSAIRLLQDGSTYLANDPISRDEQRFAALKDDLPKWGEIGYLDSPNLDEAAAKEFYFRVQYILSPLIIVESTEYEFVIGNFPEDRDKTMPASVNDLILVKDYGNGVFLWENADR